MYDNIHLFLQRISPELTLLGVVIGLISLAPIIKNFFTRSQESIFSTSDLPQPLQPAYDSRPLVTSPTLWDRFWLKIAQEASLSIDELFREGIEGVILFIVFLAALGWAASVDYNKEVTLVLSLIILFCVASTSICLMFMKRYRPTPIGAYVRYLATALFSVISIYIIRFKGYDDVAGIWSLLYFLFRSVGIAFIVIPVLMASGSMIAYARNRVIVFRNDWRYLIYSILSVFMCSDACYSVVKGLIRLQLS